MTEYRSSAYKDAETHPTGNRRQRVAAYIRGFAGKIFSREAKPEAPLVPETPEQVGTAFKLLVDRTLVAGSPDAKDKNTGHVRQGLVVAPNGDRYGMRVERTFYGATEVRVDPDPSNRARTTSMTFTGPNTAEPYAVSRPTNPYDKVPNRGIMGSEDFSNLQRLLDMTEWTDPNAAGATQTPGAQHTHHSPYANMR